MKEYYYKTSPDYFNDHKHLLCSEAPLECIVNLQNSYSTYDNGVFGGASAFDPSETSATKLQNIYSTLDN